MATIQQLLDDIKLRYKHTFTNDQVLVWMNDEQQELFDILEVDSVPYAFTTVAGKYLYPIPSDVDIDRIKVLSVQINDQSPASFQEMDFIENDPGQETSIGEYWYTLMQNNFYLNVPGGTVDNRTVYVYHDSQPTTISSSSLNIEPSTPIRWQEILKLGTLERICAARKDVVMKNNFAAEKEQKIDDNEWRMIMSAPAFTQPVNELPKRTGTLYTGGNTMNSGWS